VQPAAERTQIGAPSVVRISADTAKQFITQRVEPEYPAEARAQGIQGSVILDTLVGQDGTVQNFAAIRGDPQLAAAAATAVRQWRFRPYTQNGQAKEFQTRITVDFKLASNQ
jgi:protein TonB